MHCAWLVFLASHTATDIICSKFFHPLALVLLSEEVRCVCNPRVTHKWVVMVELQDITSLVEVVGEFDLGKTFW
jgi:hypothetical protein